MHSYYTTWIHLSPTPMRTFRASLAKSGSKSSRAFHASLSDGCTITWSFSRTPYLCHLMCLAVFFEINNYFIWDVRGMYRSCLWAVFIMTVSPTSFTTSTNLGLPHLNISSHFYALCKKSYNYLWTHQSSRTPYREQIIILWTGTYLSASYDY
jgi:hypothetical protein